MKYNEKGNNNNSRRSVVLAWVFVIAWMTIIFLFSADDGDISSYKTNQLLLILLDRFRFIFSEALLENTLLIRKLAHFFEFFVLGLLAANAFLVTLGPGKLRIASYSFTLCTVYAVTDELHQIFVPGRVASVWDVLIDAGGATLGILLFIAVLWLVNLIRERRKEKTVVG